MNTWQYDLEDADGNVLYVGITRNLRARMQQHRLGKPWWPQVDLVQAFLWPTLYDARAWEAAWINGSRRPVYNVATPRPLPFVPASHWSERLLQQVQLDPSEV